MSRALVVLAYPVDRQRAHRWIDKAPVNTRLEFKEPKRTLPQNDRMHAMLTDIASQVAHFGVRLHKDQWKLIFLAELKREIRLVPNLDGTSFVAISGQSSSDLSRQEMSDMIEMMFAYGAQHGVTFHEPRSESPEDANNASGVAA